MLLAASCGRSKPKAAADPLDSVRDAIARGDMEGAEASLRNSRDASSIILRARLLLFRNRNEEAAKLLVPLVSRKVEGYAAFEAMGEAYRHLARAFVGMDDFANAAKWHAARGESVVAKKYEHLSRNVGYLSDAKDEVTRVRLRATAPVPLVRARVNGRDATLVVDTGLDEMMLERAFAHAARVRGFGVGTDEARRSSNHLVIDEVDLGPIRVRNVPARVGKLAPIEGVTADGAIGLAFLMHFDFTIDYGRSVLILRQPGAEIRGTPVLLAEGQQLLVRGRVNGKDAVFVTVSSGLPATVAVSPHVLSVIPGGVHRLEAGGLKLDKPPLDPDAAPAGLGLSYGLTVGFSLGSGAFQGRSVRLEPQSMTLRID